MQTLEQLKTCLTKSGILAWFQGSNQLVVSAEFPNFPTSNSFWVSRFRGNWYLGTWLPAVYRASADFNLLEAITAVLHSSRTAIYNINADLAERFSLKRLTEAEQDEFMNLVDKENAPPTQ